MKQYQHYENKKRELFLDRLADIYNTKKRTVKPLVSFEQQSSLKFNPLQQNITEPALIKELKALGIDLIPIKWAPKCYQIIGDKKVLTSHEYFEKGYFYIQNASSFIPPLALNPQPGESILDMCAAPGGKSLFLAELATNKIELTLNDKSYPRLQNLKETIKKYNVDVKEFINEDATVFTDYANKFDKILVDAQCSNEGLINLQHPRAMRFWSINKKIPLQKVQTRLLANAVEALKSGGEIVYSTCTFAPEENEEVINNILKKYSNIRAVDINLEIENLVPALTSWQRKTLNSQIKLGRRVLPTPHMEGFFVMKLQKT